MVCYMYVGIFFWPCEKKTHLYHEPIARIGVKKTSSILLNFWWLHNIHTSILSTYLNMFFWRMIAIFLVLFFIFFIFLHVYIHKMFVYGRQSKTKNNNSFNIYFVLFLWWNSSQALSMEVHSLDLIQINKFFLSICFYFGVMVSL